MIFNKRVKRLSVYRKNCRPNFSETGKVIFAPKTILQSIFHNYGIVVQINNLPTGKYK